MGAGQSADTPGEDRRSPKNRHADGFFEWEIEVYVYHDLDPRN